jgi:hypothetical protein
MSLLYPDLHFFGYMPRNAIAGSHMVVLFLVFLGNLHTASHNGCTNLHSHQQCVRVPPPPPPLPTSSTTFVVVFLMVAILTGVRWDLNVVLICVSFMTRHVQHSFMCF